jgi:hypothetical protein
VSTQIWASGGGVQSAAIAALIVRGDLRPDLAVIADTGREQSTTWDYMDRVTRPALRVVGVELVRVPASEFATVDLYGGKDGASLLIPAFTTQAGGEVGKLTAYCSNEWKRRVVQRWATAQGVTAAQMWIGISVDELWRVRNDESAKWGQRYPLIDARISRGDCVALVARMGWPPALRGHRALCARITRRPSGATFAITSRAIGARRSCSTVR